MIFRKYLLSLLIFSFCLLFTGCSSSPLKEMTPEVPSQTAESYKIGAHTTITNPGEPFFIQDIKDALAYDGMYYASWVLGESIPYTNSDGKSVDLFDAQIYMLAKESPSSEEAMKDTKNWLQSAQENYIVSEEYPFSINGIDYQIILYSYKNDNPYGKGISAFASSGETALCIEFSARETFSSDLGQYLESFLSHCYIE